MARHFRDILGDMLLTTTEDAKTTNELPSPEVSSG